MLSAIIAALGGALFESPKAAAIAALTTEADRPRYFALSGVVSGLGVTIGTQVGALLLRLDFAAVSLAGAACFFLLFWLILLLMPPVRVAHETGGLGRGLGLALRDRPFVMFQVVMMGYWFMWSQFSLSLPLAGRAIAGTAGIVAWLYGVNSAVTVLLGYPLPRLAARWLTPATTLTLGVALTALGMGAVAWAPTTAALLLCVFVISVGTVLVRPGEQSVAASLANPAALGSYFGAGSLSLAIGGGVGNYAGGTLYDLGQRLDRPDLPWLIVGAIGLATTVGLWRTLLTVRRPGTGSVLGERGATTALTRGDLAATRPGDSAGSPPTPARSATTRSPGARRVYRPGSAPSPRGRPPAAR